MNEDEIRKSLRTHVFGRRLFTYDSTDSTNERAKLLAQQGEGEGTIVVAEEQTAGKGRLGRSWHSRREENLTFSMIVTPDLQPGEGGILSLTAALAVAETLTESTGSAAECKWPNDVLLAGKKCCGILSESVSITGRTAAVVIGIGVNVNQTDFPSGIGGTATSMKLASGKSFERTAVLASLLGHFETLYGLVRSRDTQTIIRKWNDACPMTGKSISVDAGGSRLSGTVVAFDRDGGMIVRTEGKDRKVLAGDVTIIQPQR